VKEYDIAIVGGGGAGLTAALYAARSRRRTIVFEGKLTGGQIATTSTVENYPGFPDGVDGFELGQMFATQAQKFGAELRLESVESLSREHGDLFKLTGSFGDVFARAVIVAAGADYNHLGIPGEEELVGKGVSYCATCDAAFFKGQEVAVVGGGDAAIDEALFISRFAS